MHHPSVAEDHQVPPPVVVIGTSAGGVEALSSVLRGLPARFPAIVCVVMHIGAKPSRLPEILGRVGPLPARQARDGEELRTGNVYIAPPDRHFVLEDHTARVIFGPRENRHRPAIDPLFRSAAATAGPRAVGVILSGSLDDGTAGLVDIVAGGGTALIQDPLDALFAGMPTSALRAVPDALVLSASEMGSMLERVVTRIAEGHMEATRSAGRARRHARERTLAAAERSSRMYSCPACGGVLSEIDDGRVVRFRCRVGHTFSAETLDGDQRDGIETVLWIALRTLEENASLSEKLAERADRNEQPAAAALFRRRSEEARNNASRIRAVVDSGRPAADEDDAAVTATAIAEAVSG